MLQQEIDPKPNQDCGDGVTDSYERQRHAEHRGNQHHAADGQRMADCSGG